MQETWPSLTVQSPDKNVNTTPIWGTAKQELFCKQDGTFCIRTYVQQTFSSTHEKFKKPHASCFRESEA